MSVVKSAPASEQRFRLSLVSWEKYEQMVAWFEGRHVRLTFDRGELEIMTVSHLHELLKHLLRRLLDAFTEELDIDIHGGGSMTFKREDLDRGLEPDECYWIAHEAQMRTVDEYNPENHPPPDLVIEVEVSRSALDRMGIYAAMQVPEVWRWDGERLLYCLLRRRRYVESEVSASLPRLTAAELVRFLDLRQTMSETKLLQEFRCWVREQQEQDWPSAPGRSSKGRKGR